MSDTEDKVLHDGLAVQRDMFGSDMAERALERATDFTRPLQELVTRYCFGEVWTRPALDRASRSMITLAMLIALDRPNEIKLHIRGALANGVSKEQIREILLHATIYCGVPLGVGAFRAAGEVLAELGLEPAPRQ